MVAQALEAPARAPIKKAKTPRWVSLEEYIKREAKYIHKHEYLNGKIVRMPYAKGPHNEISANIVGALKITLKSLPKKYRVFSSDQKIYFPELNHGSYADALAVSEQPEYWDDNQLLLINPLLIVEVLSDSTEAYDRLGKFAKYKTLSSFREYVLVKQNKSHVETWFRQEPGLWRETIVTDPNGKIDLQSLGCAISLADIYEHIEF
jgi:Uma2 family endonuclease